MPRGSIVTVRWFAATVVGLVLWAVPGSASALVSPVALIQKQIIKPNILIVMDTSSSMRGTPGDDDEKVNEVGMDCDTGLNCRTAGVAGRCYLSNTGSVGGGISGDYSSCTTNTQCQTGYCSDATRPDACQGDADAVSTCGAGATCRGRCANSPSTACTTDSACPAGGTRQCWGLTSCTYLNGTHCTQDSQCASGVNCTTFPTDFCSTAGTGVAVVKMCQIAGNRCYADSDCPTSGDSCGPASSRTVIAKRVISDVVSSYYGTANFGLMTFYQTGYYAYYKVTGSIVNTTQTRFLNKDLLNATGCWTKTTGPAASCTVAGMVYTRKSTPNSTYVVKTGSSSQVKVDVDYCGVWCNNASGMGYYSGSYYTYTDKTATAIDTSTRSIQSSYLGQTATISGSTYIHFYPSVAYSNYQDVLGQGDPAPISTSFLNLATSAATCCVNCGGNADATVAPFLDSTGATAATFVSAVLGKMAYTRHGGIVATAGTPSGCTLGFEAGNAASSWSNNALAYMNKVKTADTLSCRNNFVLFLTDGTPTGTNDTSCGAAACAAADPAAAGCTCRSVLAAQQLKAANIKTYPIGFSAALGNPAAHAIMDNIAKAGGTGTALYAVSETDLKGAMLSAVYDAAQGSYSTSPASASSGVQSGGTVTAGTMLLDTRVDFPGWRGEVVAYETSTGTPAVAWSASTTAYDYGCPYDPVTHVQPATCSTSVKRYYASYARKDEWKTRNLWTSNGTAMVKIDLSSGALASASTLSTLGLGTTATEADRVARWMAGDPSMANPAVMAAVLNSTPIDVGPVGNSPLPGGSAFYTLYGSRPNLTYVGASDGMLHAFFTHDVTVAGVLYHAGQEAFSYIPQNMLTVATKLYSQGGQLPDPKDHIYGLANSPKVKNLCTDYCDAVGGTPVWKTLLVMAYGFGGTEAFVLDITNPFDPTVGVKSASGSPPVTLQWNTGYLTSGTTTAYDNDLGLTTSLPAFYYAKSATKDDFRLLFGSYYTTGATGSMGKVLISASVKTGTIIDSPAITPAGSCTQPLGLLSDVAAARAFFATEEDQIMSAYFGDTWGNLYRYVPSVGTNNYTGATGTISTVAALTCNQPIHYAPAVVQLDRDNASNHSGEVYLVQVTNSALDDDTKSFPASHMIIRRDLGTVTGTVANDTTWTTIDLVAGGTLSGIPATARPNATPLVVLRQDGLGFDIISTWFVPPADACSNGTTYLNIYEIIVSTGAATLKYNANIASEPVTSTVFVGGKLMLVSETGARDLSSSLPAGLNFVTGSAGGGTGGSAGRYRQLGWTELP
jgi:hypothetical protein